MVIHVQQLLCLLSIRSSEEAVEGKHVINVPAAGESGHAERGVY